MAQTNVKNKSNLKTHEGGPAKTINAEMQLRRAVLACLLWEDTFYESGISIADRIAGLVKEVNEDTVLNLAREARSRFNLRHIPLHILREATRNGYKVADSLYDVIQRPDELSEFLAMYWKDGRTSIPSQVKKGLAKAFTKFDAYQLAKWNRKKNIRLKDVLFLTHAKPLNEDQAKIWEKLSNDTLETPDTWEVRLSASEKSKKENWEELLSCNKMGALALLRNLRGMLSENVDVDLIKSGLEKMKTDRVLPFRFIPAERYAPSLSADIEKAMFRSLGEHEKLSGKTLILVDSSYSMVGTKVSEKSQLDRLDAASALAILVREISDSRVFVFSNGMKEVPNRRGFGLRDVITNFHHGGTLLGNAVSEMNKIPHDRLIVFTDEQSQDPVPDPVVDKAYMINVASYKNGVGYGKWTHIDGFSEAIIDYIVEYEKEFV